MLSLRERALLGGVATGAVSVAVGTLAVLSYINSRVSDQFDSNLRDRHGQLIVGLNAATANPDSLQDLMLDPAYAKPYSGLYWQVTNDDGRVFTSASLSDETIDEPVLAMNMPTFWNTTGPKGEALRSLYQEVSYEDGTVWGVSIAKNSDELITERRTARRSLLMVFTLVGLIGLIGSLLLMSVIMRPLRKLRTDVAHRWDTEEGLKPEDYPDEVSPLVDDLNQLSRRNRDIVSGSRRQTADLAHALKTPTAILRNELGSLSDQGVTVDTAQEALDRIDAQLSRSLARMRAINTAELTHSRADLSNSVDRLSRLFSRVAEREGKKLEVIRQEDLWVRMDPQDIEEVLGNLMDNAVKWCRETVRVSAMFNKDSIDIHIEDDGPGIPEDARREALRSGGRLDTSVAGSGLGLAIAGDLLNAYGARLDLGRSKALGGLECRVAVTSIYKKRSD